jgi:hypothetical protein
MKDKEIKEIAKKNGVQLTHENQKSKKTDVKVEKDSSD